ncbi:AraC family transcriptional regulator [Mucilaginibacter sabulilitoris]|uniref:AraC family transcriptional regulator n=1 Tax=Mucilaginibacter sabulilitoris TaxID=1173583 RepID=A0ABZ0TNC6_9SPHI|nr:AraC family transcriptional regulator [Mucilaginibacter sabulilitoris]WPU93698.1 AraC family transcriptional regulator [Mucilaginibacter sabulilitoris]
MQIFKEGHHISRVIDSVQPPDFIASRTLLSPEDFNGARHYHDNAHFSFVLRGGCAEVKRTHYERLPGSITWYEAGEPHQMTKVKTPSYHVNFELPENFFTTYGIKESAIGHALKVHPGAGIMMVRTYNELDKPDVHSEDALRMLLLGLIQGQAKLEASGIPAWVKIVQELLNDKWNENITLAELSIACGIHPVTISRYFPVYFSFTFGQYCRMLKVRHAISMIRLKRTNLFEVAYACGFSDQSHFIRNFKAYTGILPATWQKI